MACFDIMKRHKVALITAFLVGIIAVAPVVFFRVSLGADWRGIDLFYSDNEEFYLARMHEITDGYPLIGSISYYEYKNNLPMLPPTAETTYVFLSRLFGASLSDIMVVTKFLFPMLLFLLVYKLVRNMTDEPDSPGTVLYGIAAGTLVVLGFDLVDYGRLLNIIRGNSNVGGMVIWTRPVNPIFGALALFSFLNALWYVIVKKSKLAVVLAGIALAFMFGSYFFSWGTGLSILFWFGVFGLCQKDIEGIKNLVKLFGIGLVLASPYWYLVVRAHFNQFFVDSSGRYGLIYSHNPLINKILLLGIIIGVVAIVVYLWKTKKDDQHYNWIYFSGAFLLGGLLALNQQVITGMTIWPFHFVQYTTPLFFIVLVVILYHVVRPRLKILAQIVAVFFIVLSTGFAIYTGMVGYKEHFVEYRERQKLASIFDWFNKHTPKDSVVFVKDDANFLQRLIPAYTHNNVYVSEPANAMASYERFYHNYLIFLRMKGVSGDYIQEYLRVNASEAASFLHTKLLSVAGDREAFPEVNDYVLERSLSTLPEDYRAFLDRNLLEEFYKYRLDYILSYQPLEPKIHTELGNPAVVFTEHGFFIYDLSN